MKGKQNTFHVGRTINKLNDTIEAIIKMISDASNAGSVLGFKYGNLLLFDICRIIDGVKKVTLERFGDFEKIISCFERDKLDHAAVSNWSVIVDDMCNYSRVFSFHGIDTEKFPKYTDCSSWRLIYDNFVDYTKNFTDTENFSDAVDITTKKFQPEIEEFADYTFNVINRLESLIEKHSHPLLAKTLKLARITKFDFWRIVIGLNYDITKVGFGFVNAVIDGRHDFGGKYPQHVFCYKSDPNSLYSDLIDDSRFVARVEDTYSPLAFFDYLDDKWITVKRRHTDDK